MSLDSIVRVGGGGTRVPSNRERREMAAWAAQDLFAQFGLEVDIDTIFALHERIS